MKERWRGGGARAIARSGAVVAAALVLLPFASQSVSAETSAGSGGSLINFDGKAVAGVFDFQYSYAKIGLIPYTVRGGGLESSAEASSTGNAQGIAGVMPVPLVATLGAVFPSNDPVTGTPVPDQFRKGYEHIDFGSLPNSCKSEYPDVYQEGRDDRFCGGPALEDPGPGFTAGMMNGHTKSSGDPDDPFKARAVSESRAVDVTIPSLQAQIHGAWSESVTGLNNDGLPEARAAVEIGTIKIVNGLVTLHGLRSAAVAVTDGSDEGTKTSTEFSIGEAFVFGVPVVIGREGVTVNGEKLLPGQSMQDAAKQVSDALKEADLQMRLAPPPATDRNGSQASIASSGLEIVHRGDTVTPADSFYRFGFVFANTSAARSSGESATVPSSGDISPVATADSSPRPEGSPYPAPDRSDLPALGMAWAPSGADAATSSGTGSFGFTGREGGDGSFGSEGAVPAADTTAGTGVPEIPFEAAAPEGSAGSTLTAQPFMKSATRQPLPAAGLRHVGVMAFAIVLLLALSLPLRRVLS